MITLVNHFSSLGDRKHMFMFNVKTEMSRVVFVVEISYIQVQFSNRFQVTL